MQQEINKYNHKGIHWKSEDTNLKSEGILK